eukprot:Amastigsp_a180931_43.p3 type:complete len:220 gc:universal Amastigsp_a180931_43:213-872(+)
MGKLMRVGTEGSLSRRCTGWSPSWFVPERARFVSRSKVMTPSGLGYSMGFALSAFCQASLSACASLSVYGSLPIVTVSRPEMAMPAQSPCWNAGRMLRTLWSSSQIEELRSAASYEAMSIAAQSLVSRPLSAVATASAASMPERMAVCVPLTLGTFMNPAEQPMSAPPGKFSLGIDCRPPSLSARAPYEMHLPPSSTERMSGCVLNCWNVLYGERYGLP